MTEKDIKKAFLRCRASKIYTGEECPTCDKRYYYITDGPNLYINDSCHCKGLEDNIIWDRPWSELVELAQSNHSVAEQLELVEMAVV